MFLTWYRADVCPRRAGQDQVRWGLLLFAGPGLSGPQTFLWSHEWLSVHHAADWQRGRCAPHPAQQSFWLVVYDHRKQGCLHSNMHLFQCIQGLEKQALAAKESESYISSPCLLVPTGTTLALGPGGTRWAPGRGLCISVSAFPCQSSCLEWMHRHPTL